METSQVPQNRKQTSSPPRPQDVFPRPNNNTPLSLSRQLLFLLEAKALNPCKRDPFCQEEPFHGPIPQVTIHNLRPFYLSIPKRKGHFNKFHQAWVAWGASPWIVSILREDYHLEFERPPPLSFVGPVIMSSKSPTKMEILQVQFNFLLKKGASSLHCWPRFLQQDPHCSNKLSMSF